MFKTLKLSAFILCAAFTLASQTSRAETRFLCSEKSNFNNTYAGEGASQLEAKTNAIQACEEKESGIFCENEVSCDSSEQGWSRRYDDHVFFCAETSNFNKTYSGQGYSQVEAQTNAIQACEADVNGMFCENAVTCQ